MQEVINFRKKVEDANYKLSKHQITVYKAFHSSYLLLYYNAVKDIIPEETPVNFLDGTPFLKKFNRLVIGAHGPYIEFKVDDYLIPIDVPEDQTWRLGNRYDVKYHHLTPLNRNEKIYYQVKHVDYADYVPGRYYVDFYETDLSNETRRTRKTEC